MTGRTVMVITITIVGCALVISACGGSSTTSHPTPPVTARQGPESGSRPPVPKRYVIPVPHNAKLSPSTFHGHPAAPAGASSATAVVTTSHTKSTVAIAGGNVIAAPTVYGQPQVGATLTATSGSWLAAKRLMYRWRRCTVTGLCKAIKNATEPTYRVRKPDVGFTLQVVVIPIH